MKRNNVNKHRLNKIIRKRSILISLATLLTFSNLNAATAVGQFDTTDSVASATLVLPCNGYYFASNYFKFRANSNLKLRKVQVYLYEYFDPGSLKVFSDSNGAVGVEIGNLDVTSHPLLTEAGIATFIATNEIELVSGSSYWLKTLFMGACYNGIPVDYSETGITVNLDNGQPLHRFSTIINSAASYFAFFAVPSVSSPNSPTTVSVSTGKRSAKVRFSAPASNGGSAITSYSATSSPGGFTQTINQSEGGTFYFDGLEPNTFYTFAVTATNAIGTSAPAVSLASRTEALVVASMSELTFQDNGTGTAGKIVWTGMNIDAVLYTGDPAFYPGPFNYGAFTGGWNGQIRNLTPSTSYTVSINAISADGVGESKSLTFKTSAAPLVQAGYLIDPITKAEQSSNSLFNVFMWIDENIHDSWEDGSLKTVLDKFNRLDASKSSAYLQMPYSRVLTISAYSFTPEVCLAGGIGNVITSRKVGTCTIAFTVNGPSRAPVTLIKNLVFNKFTNW